VESAVNLTTKTPTSGRFAAHDWPPPWQRNAPCEGAWATSARACTELKRLVPGVITLMAFFDRSGWFGEGGFVQAQLAEVAVTSVSKHFSLARMGVQTRAE